MPRLPRDLSVADIEGLLQRRRAELKSLSRERERLQQALNGVDQKIRNLAGKAGKSSGPTVRARNEKSLVETLESVLGKAGRPMTVSEILDAVARSNYHSNAANFRGIVNQTLIRERKRFVNTARATYAIKK